MVAQEAFSQNFEKMEESIEVVERPLVSIIVPVLDRLELLQETVFSIQAQSYEEWELILVDDGSLEQTKDYLQKTALDDPRMRYLTRPIGRKAGGNAARNFGFENSKGSLINWFDSDDRMHPLFLEKKVSAFLSKRECSIVFSKTIETDFEKLFSRNDRLYCSKNILRDYILRNVSWFLPDAMFNRAYLIGKILFDEDLKGGQDRDFFISLMANEKPSYVILDFYATFYRLHSNSISEKMYRRVDYVVQLSHYRSLVKQLRILEKKNILDEGLRFHYFRELKKRFPAVVKTNSAHLLLYLNELLEISSFERKYLKGWLQLLLSCCSFLLVGKGERFLK